MCCERSQTERFCILPSQETSTHTQNLPTAKGSRCVAVEGGRGVTANSLWQIFLGCWENYLDWSGHISVCQTLHFKWVHFMYVNSSSIKPNNTKYSQLKVKLNTEFICIQLAHCFARLTGFSRKLILSPLLTLSILWIIFGLSFLLRFFNCHFHHKIWDN